MGYLVVQSDATSELARWAETGFRVGRGIGLVSGSTMALLEPLNAELAQRLWRLISENRSIDELLEALSATGLRTLGAFSMVQLEGDSLRVVVRGTAGVRVVTADGMRDLSALGVRTWHEVVIDRPSSVELYLGEPLTDGPQFRVTAGCIPASALQRGSGIIDDVERETVERLEVPAVADVLIPAPESAAEERGAASAAADELVGSPASPDPGVTRSYSDHSDAAADDAGVRDSEQSLMADSSSVGGAGELELDEDSERDGGKYDAIWGHTQLRTVGSAAVHYDEAGSRDSLHADVPQPPAVVSPELPEPNLGGAAGKPEHAPNSPLIQGVPGAPQAQHAGVPSAPSGLGDHDGRTLTKAQLQAMRAGSATGAAPPGAAAMGGPSVQALLCASQHPNPPHESSCRQCGQSLGGTPIAVPRPTLGTLRFSNSMLVVLNRPAVIGRNPKLQGASTGEVPDLVKIDVGQGLSRTHAAVNIEGWQVLLEDLNSANGTIVQLPGREPRRLHPGEPVLLEHGTTVDFGGEISCIVELG